MKITKKYLAFTLIEILVWMALIGVIAIGISRLNFNRLSDMQRIEIETTAISSILEETRNNALIWRWVWTNFTTPSEWKIIINNSTPQGTVVSQYNTSWYTSYRNWAAVSPFTIREIRCKDINGWSSEMSSNVELSFQKSSINISSWSCTQAKAKIIEIDFGNSRIFKTIQMNTISWVIEIN